MNIVKGLRRLWSILAVPLISILLALVVGAVIIVASELAVGQQLDLLLPLEAYAGLIQGAIGSQTAIVSSLVAAAPLILGGLSVAFGFRAGLFNIGAQGQFWLGMLGAVSIGVTRRAPAARDRHHLVAHRRNPCRCLMGLHSRRVEGTVGCP